MAPEPLMFVTISKTFDITEYSISKGIGKKNGIQLERFTLGGYDWAIECYLQAINESVQQDKTPVSVRVLDAMEEVGMLGTFYIWNWTHSNWVKVTTSPLGENGHWGLNTNLTTSNIERPEYLKDDTIRMKCALFVTPRPAPAPASDVKTDVDKVVANGSKGSLSGTDISFASGFHTAIYSPPNAPSNEYTKLPKQPTVRIYCQANNDLSITARNGTVVLAPSDPYDHYQHWIKDMNYGDKVKDASGLPAFALVNRVTGEALKNPVGENQEVSLIPYNMNRLDDSVKWTVVWSTGFLAIRIADRTSLNLTAVGSDNDTNFSDGAKMVVKKWDNTAVQRWKIVPYNSIVPYQLICNPEATNSKASKSYPYLFIIIVIIPLLFSLFVPKVVLD